LETLPIDAELRAELTTVATALRQRVRGSEASQTEFWADWREFGNVLRKIAQKPALWYCQERVKSMCVGVHEAIRAIAAQPLSSVVQKHRELCERMRQSFRVIEERFWEIGGMGADDGRKIAELEGMRKQVRQLRADITGVYQPCFALPTVGRSKMEALRMKLDDGLAGFVEALSDLRKQAALLDGIDGHLERTEKTLMMMNQNPLARARGQLPCENGGSNVVRTSSKQRRDGRAPQRLTETPKGRPAPHIATRGKRSTSVRRASVTGRTPGKVELLGSGKVTSDLESTTESKREIRAPPQDNDTSATECISGHESGLSGTLKSCDSEKMVSEVAGPGEGDRDHESGSRIESSELDGGTTESSDNIQRVATITPEDGVDAKRTPTVQLCGLIELPAHLSPKAVPTETPSTATGDQQELRGLLSQCAVLINRLLSSERPEE
jgi:hypothetical protein